MGLGCISPQKSCLDKTGSPLWNSCLYVPEWEGLFPIPHLRHKTSPSIGRHYFSHISTAIMVKFWRKGAELRLPPHAKFCKIAREDSSLMGKFLPKIRNFGDCYFEYLSPHFYTYNVEILLNRTDLEIPQRHEISSESLEEFWTWPVGIALPWGGDAYWFLVFCRFRYVIAINLCKRTCIMAVLIIYFCHVLNFILSQKFTRCSFVIRLNLKMKVAG